MNNDEDFKYICMIDHVDTKNFTTEKWHWDVFLQILLNGKITVDSVVIWSDTKPLPNRNHQYYSQSLELPNLSPEQGIQTSFVTIENCNM